MTCKYAKTGSSTTMNNVRLGIDTVKGEILNHFENLQEEHAVLQQNYKEAIREKNIALDKRNAAIKDMEIAIKERDRSIVEKVTAIKEKIASNQDRERATVARIKATNEKDKAVEAADVLANQVENLEERIHALETQLANTTAERDYYLERSIELDDSLQKLEKENYYGLKNLERKIQGKLNSQIEFSHSDLLEGKLEEAIQCRMNLHNKLEAFNKELEIKCHPDAIAMLERVIGEIEDRKNFWDKRVAELEADIHKLKNKNIEISDNEHIKQTEDIEQIEHTNDVDHIEQIKNSQLLVHTECVEDVEHAKNIEQEAQYSEEV